MTANAPETSSHGAEQQGSAAGFPIVALGASAGGLEALKAFLSRVPEDSGMAFVVVTHQHAGHVTMLPELLAKDAKIAVGSVEDGMRLEPNRVYVVPPGANVSLESGVLRLTKMEVDRRAPLPIDHFFRSLARDAGEKAIAVVLSGTGSDGTLGAAEIKGAGGIVVAQDSASAQYTGMPSSVAATPFVDAILPPEEMPKQLQRYAHHRPVLSDEHSAEMLHRVLVMLRERSGHDFTAYKKSTLGRRVERRMSVHGIGSIREYAAFLQQRPQEADALFRELLISVTSFFRDPATFDVLISELTTLIQRRDPQRALRVWVPACATGEEAYSIAIAIKEIVAHAGTDTSIQAFATDLDQQAIDAARLGRYPAGIAADVSPERLKRYFTRDESGFRVNKEIREIIVFATQDLIKDPPFTKLDVISCRNLLIYLEPELQRRVLGLFSYALRPGGLLLLGGSESIGGFDEAFSPVDKKCKLFRRRETRMEPPVEFREATRVHVGAMVHRPQPSRPASAIAAIADRVLLSSFAPPSVLVTEHGDIAYFHGRTGQFLEPPAGEPSTNLFGMLREGLRLELPSAIRQAASRDEVVVRSGLQVRSNGGFVGVRLTVRRLEEPEAVRGMFLVSFELEPIHEPSRKAAGPGQENSKQDLGRTAELELELSHTRENLQGTIEELETSNEELKSTNEELQSTNEELQSANEELETSREEMQSLNEELQTVNSELEERNRALSQSNDDMQNLLNSTDVAAVFLDDKLVIKRFTTQARKVFSLIDTDIGRPISDLSANLRYEGLLSDAGEVLRSLVFREKEIQTKEGAWRLMRIMPFRTAENVIDGLVMTFIDIDRIKGEEQAAQRGRRFFEAVIESLPIGLVAVDEDLRIVTVNRAFCVMFGTTPKRAMDEALHSLGTGFFEQCGLSEELARVFTEGYVLRGLRVAHDVHRVGRKALRIDAEPLLHGDRTLALLTIVDESPD